MLSAFVYGKHSSKKINAGTGSSRFLLFPLQTHASALFKQGRKGDNSMDVAELLEHITKTSDLRASVFDLLRKGKKWDAYRAYYKAVLPEIMQRRGNRYDIDPYFIDWLTQFTPIEYDAWQTIRNLCLPLYPQFPVGNVFVDFGDPVKKIAIECDGKDFHNEKDDYSRDELLNRQGWVVFRVTGSECNKPGIDFESLGIDLESGCINEDGFLGVISDWANNTSDGLITAIGFHYYGVKPYHKAARFLRESLASHSNFFFYGE